MHPSIDWELNLKVYMHMQELMKKNLIIIGQKAYVKYGCEAQKCKLFLTGPGMLDKFIVYFSKKKYI